MSGINRSVISRPNKLLIVHTRNQFLDQNRKETKLVHEPGPRKGDHRYHKKVHIIIVIFDEVYICTTYFCMLAVCM